MSTDHVDLAELADKRSAEIEIINAEEPVDFNTFVAELAELARGQDPDNPVPVMAGTFAMYPMPDGGIMFVTAVPTGPLQGTKHTRITPGILRAAVALAGGSKIGAVKGLFGRKPRAIGSE